MSGAHARGRVRGGAAGAPAGGLIGAPVGGQAGSWAGPAAGTADGQIAGSPGGAAGFPAGDGVLGGVIRSVMGGAKGGGGGKGYLATDITASLVVFLVALPLLYAATAPGVRPDAFLGPSFAMWRGAPAPSWRAPWTLNDAIAERLWAASERLTGVTYDALKARLRAARPPR